MKLMSQHRVVSRKVATYIWRCDLAWARAGAVRSRPRPSAMGQFGVATWSFEVANWGRMPGRVATSARPASERPTLSVRVTCARLVSCTRSSAHDLGTAQAVCARLSFWVCALCTQPNFVTVHCLGSWFEHCSWTLFMSTFHRVKKKKRAQNF